MVKIFRFNIVHIYVCMCKKEFILFYKFSFHNSLGNAKESKNSQVRPLGESLECKGTSYWFLP